MVKRNYSGDYKNEPEQSSYKLISTGEHLFQVTDVITFDTEIGTKLNLDENTVVAKCEVIGGQDEGLELLQRLSLDENWKGFFATRLFLKAIGEPHKGEGFDLDSDRWVGKQFYGDVVHNKSKDKDKEKTYANIGRYNFDKTIEKPINQDGVIKPEDIKWDE